MRRLPLAVVLLFAAGFAHAQKLGPVDWIFLVDTSASMVGAGKAKNIFGAVKQSLGSFVDEANDGDTVAIFTFDRNVALRSAMKVDSSSRADLHDIIDGLEAKGDRTHLGAAIAAGLERAASVRDTHRTRAVILFTDGLEDIRGIPNATTIGGNLQNVGDTFLFFVSMGKLEPKLKLFSEATPKAKVLDAPTLESIRDIARRIRVELPEEQPHVEPKPKPKPVATPAPPPPPPSRWMQAAKAAIALAVIALIAVIALEQQRRKNRLEGELEILHPRTAPDAAFVGLPKLQTNEVELRSIVPIDAIASSDARLFVRRNGGRKKIWIAAQDGSLRVNEIATPMTELFDADTIEIGDARLRFNRVGDERPAHQEEAL